jgi:DNA-binding transcriptional ArsR family regulator
VNSRRIPRNPLYKAWKAASFTKNDIRLHFFLLDILADGKLRTLTELVDAIDADYLSAFENAEPIDISTLRNKLKEYVEIGLITAEKQGRQHTYSLPTNTVDLESWRDATAFFSEGNPLGVVGSFLLDKYEAARGDIFSFKHRYLLFALDNGILLELLSAIRARRKIEIETAGGGKGGARRAVVIPLKIYCGTQGGRQYLAAYSFERKGIAFFRLDSMIKVKTLESVSDYDVFRNQFEDIRPNIWGVATGQYKLEHIEMVLSVDPEDIHIAHRLEREKRCGAVGFLGDTRWRFSADVYDAQELLPWLRTFIGRIVSLTCSNEIVEKQFWGDLAALEAMYGGDGDAV